MGFIIRNTKHFHDVFSLTTLYNSLVRSKLEYACEIWNPYFKSQNNKIESIQKKFLRYLYYKIHLVSPLVNRVSYSSMLKEFNFVTLPNIRKYLEQLSLYKVLKEKIWIIATSYKISS